MSNIKKLKKDKLKLEQDIDNLILKFMKKHEVPNIEIEVEQCQVSFIGHEDSNFMVNTNVKIKLIL